MDLLATKLKEVRHLNGLQEQFDYNHTRAAALQCLASAEVQPRVFWKGYKSKLDVVPKAALELKQEFLPDAAIPPCRSLASAVLKVRVDDHNALF